MGRSESKQISQQSEANAQQDQANATAAVQAANKSLGDYSTRLNKFMTFGRQTYGANGEFMKDQNAIANTTAAAGSNAVKGDMALNAMRTGENTASYAPALAESRRAAERDMTSQLAGADASRLDKLTAINQYGVQASALPASVQAGLYGTSVGGSNSAMGTAASAAQASPGFWDVFGQDVASGAGAAIGAYTGAKAGCWIAAAVFGEDFSTGEKTNLVRNWLWTVWIEHWYAKPILALYTMFGKRAAKSTGIVRLLSPLFHRALREAING